jgi:hypothetical protein
MAPIGILAELGNDWKTSVNLGHFRAYGCRALVYNESAPRGDKFSSRVLVGKLVGYERGATNIFYVYVPEKGRVTRTSNVDFDESRFDTNADTSFATDPDEDNGCIDPAEELYSMSVSTSSGGEDMDVEEVPTIDESSHNSDHEHSSRPIEELAEDFINTGIPEPGAQTPPQSPYRSETPSESDPEDNIIVAPRPRPPETSNRRSERERIKSTKASANDA